jgi:phage-related baseplate assembly protein
MSRFDAVDLSQLPAPNVVQPLDFAAILAARIADLATRFQADPSTANIATLLQYEVDPSVKIQESGAYREVVHYNRVNDAAKAVLVAYAIGPDLDNLGALMWTPRLPGELDAAYRARLVLAGNAQNNAGPAGGIVYEAMSASSNVIGVGLSKVPYTGRVSVYILSSEAGGLPSQATLQAVRSQLLGDSVKLMTDEISVNPAAIRNYQVSATLTIPLGPDPTIVQTAAIAAVQAYVNACYNLGQTVYANMLEACLSVPNVINIQMASPPADIVCDQTTAPYCTNIAITVVAQSGNGTSFVTPPSITYVNVDIADSIASLFNGTLTAFPLTVGGTAVSPLGNAYVEVVLNGVSQNPGTDFTVFGPQIIFSTAPAQGSACFIRIFI